MANEKRDLIDRRRLLRDTYFQEGRYPESHLLRMAIKEQHSVDAVEVVRCKDCKHRYTASSGVIFCTQHLTMSANDNDFCSYGERRTDG
jgi:hypothetical protein